MPDGVGHRVFRRDRYAQVDVIWHRVPFYDLYPLDSCPLVDRLYRHTFLGSVQFFAPILRYPYNVVLTIPDRA
jgi:hypothetical protein